MPIMQYSKISRAPPQMSPAWVHLHTIHYIDTPTRVCCVITLHTCTLYMYTCINFDVLVHFYVCVCLSQTDILDINDIFRDLGTMVNDQGELVGKLLHTCTCTCTCNLQLYMAYIIVCTCTLYMYSVYTCTMYNVQQCTTCTCIYMYTSTSTHMYMYMYMYMYMCVLVDVYYISTCISTCTRFNER